MLTNIYIMDSILGKIRNKLIEAVLFVGSILNIYILIITVIITRIWRTYNSDDVDINDNQGSSLSKKLEARKTKRKQKQGRQRTKLQT